MSERTRVDGTILIVHRPSCAGAYSKGRVRGDCIQRSDTWRLNAINDVQNRKIVGTNGRAYTLLVPTGLVRHAQSQIFQAFDVYEWDVQGDLCRMT